MHTTTTLQGASRSDCLSRFNDWYDDHLHYEGSEPTVITVHRVWDCYGGPEEGGWWFRCGSPVENICIFSREQAVKELFRLHQKYEAEDYEGEEYDICLSQYYAKWYPETKPHYE